MRRSQLFAAIGLGVVRRTLNRSHPKWLATHKFLVVLTSTVVLGIAFASVSHAQYMPAGCASAEEDELAGRINAYREESGLVSIPLSSTLTTVGQWHASDLAYAIDVTGDYGSDPSCSGLRSWYGIPGALYTSCCYPPDHSNVQCMWGKPNEISAGSYTSSGYEIVASGYTDVAAALEAWKNSSAHNDLLLNQGAWSSVTFRAMGIGVNPDKKHYFAWFATVTDPAGAAPSCSAEAVPSLSPTGAALLGGLVFAIAIAGLAVQRRRRAP